MRDISDVQSPGAKGHDSHLHVDGAAPGRQSAALEQVERQAVAKNAHVWKRNELDWYVEPATATEALLSVEKFVGAIWDPCCGQGNIVKTLLSHGYDAVGSDVAERALASAEWFSGTADFLVAESGELVDEPNIVMNAPFFRGKGAEAFIRKALAIARGKVCAFVDIRFLAGAERARGLFTEWPPTRIWIVTPRVSCPPGDYLAAGGKAGNGSSDWCWLVWDKTAPVGETRLGWLRRTK